MFFSKLLFSLKLENVFFLLKGHAIWMAHSLRQGRVYSTDITGETNWADLF